MIPERPRVIAAQSRLRAQRSTASRQIQRGTPLIRRPRGIDARTSPDLIATISRTASIRCRVAELITTACTAPARVNQCFTVGTTSVFQFPAALRKCSGPGTRLASLRNHFRQYCNARGLIALSPSTICVWSFSPPLSAPWLPFRLSACCVIRAARKECSLSGSALRRSPELQVLESEHCTEVQGYLLGRPSNIETFRAITHGEAAEPKLPFKRAANE